MSRIPWERPEEVVRIHGLAAELVNKQRYLAAVIEGVPHELNDLPLDAPLILPVRMKSRQGISAAHRLYLWRCAVQQLRL